MSFSSSDDDSQQRFALGFLFALIALVVSTVIGVVVYKRGMAHAPTPGAATVVQSENGAVVGAAGNAATVAGAGAAQDGPSVVVEAGVVKFYFASGKSDLADGAQAALAEVIAAVQQQGKTAVISGYHDATGDAARNAELAKLRAQGVRDVLLTLGVAEDKLELKKPEVTQADGNNAQARRVEVTLAP